jgi:hypothetical protein
VTTYAPQTLLDCRHCYMEYTGITDFTAVGIVGDDDHDGGYHCGWSGRKTDSHGNTDDYSWEESSRDSNHKTNAASAIDFGWFDITINGKRTTLIDFNLWMVEQLNAGAPDTLDIREFIYTPDGKIVKRWDRLKIRTGGDNSHLTHSHCSRFRDAENKPLAPLVERFFGGTVDPLLVAQIGNSEHYLQSIVGMTDEAHNISNVTVNDLKIPNQFIVAFKELTKVVDSLKADIAELSDKIDGMGTGSAPSVPTVLNVTSGVLNIGPTEG